ncbi:PelD GGDEF domain-containing protein [Burkholderia gladioli]|uniref:PelD GGDEF domain-containing protein n=1 Tax=Burkholderia gladioli TaxID=28095 RepID=UPI00155F61E8|nr:PelD GGDEF domain-containing protein [Burkholderia gladioli]MBU9640362.1 GAF domain-containing protein [Burkholderia gladioli]MBU9682010.1 GAF domain-containing protein [Burkholderia gladioli]NRF84527.1 GAF domain-containing protein [Burkholderia gladioli]
MNTQATGPDPGESRAAPRSRTVRATGAAAWWSTLIAPPEGSARRRTVALLETLGFTLIAIGLCRAFSADDPLLIHSGFGWIWLVPVVVSLRYGSVAGLVSGFVLLAAWYLLYPAVPVPVVTAVAAGAGAAGASASAVFTGDTVLSRPFPVGFFFGGFFLTLLTGQFGDIWMSRLRQNRIANDYLSERLSILTRNQFMLRLSHERLEQDLLSRPATLRDSLARLRAVVFEQLPTPAEQGDLALRGAQAFLDAAAQAVQLEVASVHAWRQGAPAAEAAASVGGAGPLDVHDPLVREAIETRRLVHVDAQAHAGAAAIGSRYLACVPLLDVKGEPVGVVAIERMPFLALTRDNLQFLLVLCSFYADGVRHAEVSHEMLSAFPACPQRFALDYARLVHLRRDSKVLSSVVTLVFDNDEQGAALSEHIVRTRRALDSQWEVIGSKRRAVLTLMPLSGASGVDGYLLRIEDNLRAQFGVDFEAAHVAVYSMNVPASEPMRPLVKLMEHCGVAG